MNSVIYQLGVLAFLMSFIVLGMRGGIGIETLVRAFIVFVGTILLAELMLVLRKLLLKQNATREPNATPSNNQRDAQQQPFSTHPATGGRKP